MNSGNDSGYWYKDSAGVRIVSRCARSAAVLSALFVFGVAVLTAAGWLQLKIHDPLSDTALTALREELKADPGREDLRKEIRGLDFAARRVYFVNSAHVREGAWLMVFGLVVLVASAGLAAEMGKRLPSSSDIERNNAWRSMGSAWRVMVSFAVLAGVGGLWTSIMLQNDMKTGIGKGPDGAGGIEPPPVEAGAVNVSDEQLAVNWPRFLGAFGRAAAGVSNVPSSWSLSEGKGVLWRTALSLQGYGSPIVWGKKVFLAQANDTVSEVMCVDLDSGNLLWKKTVGPYAGTMKHEEGLFDMSMHAAATPATDGSRVFMIFGNGDLACFDFDGNEIWGRNTGLPAIGYGYASSPVVCRGKLIVQLELNDRITIAAMDPATGNVIWETPRPHPSWSTPAVLRKDGNEILVCASSSSLSAYDPDTGRQLWVVEGCMSGDVGSSAVCDGDMIYISSMSEGVRAYRVADGAPEMLWKWDVDPADMASPLPAGGYIFIASGVGLTCLDGTNGSEKWHAELKGGFYATPVFAGGKVYALGRNGLMQIFEASGELNIAGANPSGEKTDATPAFVDGKIIVRTAKELVCFGK